MQGSVESAIASGLELGEFLGNRKQELARMQFTGSEAKKGDAKEKKGDHIVLFEPLGETGIAQLEQSVPTSVGEQPTRDSNGSPDLDVKGGGAKGGAPKGGKNAKGSHRAANTGDEQSRPASATPPSTADSPGIPRVNDGPGTKTNPKRRWAKKDPQ